jgi:hypothetical protein
LLSSDGPAASSSIHHHVLSSAAPHSSTYFGKEVSMPLARTILEAPEHQFEDDDWDDDEELGTDGEELDLDEFDDIEEIEDEDE